MLLISTYLFVQMSLPSSSWVQCVEAPLPWTSVTEVWRRGLAGEHDQGAPKGIPMSEEDTSGRHTGKYRGEDWMFPFGLPFPFSLELAQPGNT